MFIVALYVVCCSSVVDTGNDKVVDTGNDKVVDTDGDIMVDRDGDITMDTVVSTDSEATSTPMIEDITKDDNFVDVSISIQ